MSVKINSLEVENMKRIRAVALTPSASGLTVIGGRNGQGKTSVLDAIAWALGGDRYKPEEAHRDGSVTPPALRVTLSNGIVVERKGDKGTLRVIDPSGRKGGQQLLNEFIAQLALDLPRFLNASDKEKAETLLKIIGVGDKLAELDRQEAETYNRRRTIGQIATQKRAQADGMATYKDVPDELLHINDLIRERQTMADKNAENKARRDAVEQLTARVERAREEFDAAMTALNAAEEAARGLIDADTSEIDAQIANAEEINSKIQANSFQRHAEKEADEYKAQYDAMSEALESIRAERTALLDGADLPLEGLGVRDGALTYNGHVWDSMSGSEQLRVATAIVRKINPECGFVLMDKLEQLDADTLTEFGAWLEQEGLQVIATRVSTGGECQLIIEDGYSVDRKVEFKEGEF